MNDSCMRRLTECLSLGVAPHQDRQVFAHHQTWGGLVWGGLARMLQMERLRVLLEHHICSQLGGPDGQQVACGTPWSWPWSGLPGASEHEHLEQLLVANGGLIVSILFGLGSELTKDMAFQAFFLLDVDYVLSVGFERRLWATQHADLLLGMMSLATSTSVSQPCVSTLPLHRLNWSLVLQAAWIVRHETSGSPSSSSSCEHTMLVRDTFASSELQSELYSTHPAATNGPGDHGEPSGIDDDRECETDSEDDGAYADHGGQFPGWLAGRESPMVIDDTCNPAEDPEDTNLYVVSDRMLWDAAGYRVLEGAVRGLHPVSVEQTSRSACLRRARCHLVDDRQPDVDALAADAWATPEEACAATDLEEPLAPEEAKAPAETPEDSEAPPETPEDAEAPAETPEDAAAPTETPPAKAPATAPAEAPTPAPADALTKHERKIDLQAERTKWIKSFKADPMNTVDGESLTNLHKRAMQAWTSSAERHGFLQMYDEKERKRRRF